MAEISLFNKKKNVISFDTFDKVLTDTIYKEYNMMYKLLI